MRRRIIGTASFTVPAPTRRPTTSTLTARRRNRVEPIRTIVWFVLFATLFTAKASHAAPNSDGEDIPRNEAAATSRIVSLIRDTVTQGHTEEGLAHRDAHRKAHGC